MLRIIAPRDRAFATQGYIFIFWLTLATVLLTPSPSLFIRNQVRAIERLADAADAFGRGARRAPFKPYGASEVRQAAQRLHGHEGRASSATSTSAPPCWPRSATTCARR